MAKTYYELIKQFFSSSLVQEVYDKLTGILNALDVIMSKEQMQYWLNMFLGFAGSLVVIFWAMDLYDKASRDTINLERFILALSKVVLAIAILVLLPDILMYSFKICSTTYKYIASYTIQEGTNTLTVFGVTPNGIKIKEEQKTDKKEEKETFKIERDHIYYLHSKDVNGQKTDFYYYNFADWQKATNNLGLTEADLDVSEKVRGENLEGIDQTYVIGGPGGNEEETTTTAAVKRLVYDQNGNEVSDSELPADNIFDEEGFPDYEYCKVNETGNTSGHNGESIQDALESEYGTGVITALAKGELNMGAFIIVIIYWLVEKATTLIALAIAISNALSLIIRTIFAPLAVAQVFEDGSRSSGIRYIKKYIATGFMFAIIAAVLYAVAILTDATTQTIIGTDCITIENTEKVIENSFLFLVYRITAIIGMIGGAKMANEVVGAQ